jgi:ABC-2 type transport system ATP-binding protein
MSAVVDRMGPAVEVAGLTKAYGDRTVVHDLSFRIAAGEVFALLGPNGAGKTTTVEIVEGYRRADQGTVTVLGADPARAGRDHRARVGLMLQGGGGIEPRMTAREVIGLHARFHAAPRDPDGLLAMVGLSDAAARTRFRRLSGGERQRLSLALALVGRPAVAILDEPTAGMDVEARAATRQLLRGLRDEGTAVLLTSHDLADVERVADRIAIIDRGRLIAAGTPDELTAAASPSMRFRLASPLTAGDVTALGDRLSAAPAGVHAQVVEDGGSGRYRVLGLEPTPAAVATLAAWLEAKRVLVLELRAGGGSLEERYLELIGLAPEVDEDADAAGAPAALRGDAS